jgi:hypothetical protein
MTALSVLQKATARMSLTQPSIAFSSTDDLVIQLREIMNEEVIDLSRVHAWTKLTKEKTFTTVAQAVQTSAVPDDFDWYLNETMWNRTLSRKLHGPLTAEEWQREQAGPAATSVYNSFRFRGGDILITPSPTAGQTAAYEYISIYRVEDADGNRDQEVYAADDDVAVLDEELITQGVIWRFKQRKNFDYAEDFQSYFRNLEKAIGRDGGKKILSLTSPSIRRAYAENVPEGSWYQ